MLALITGVPSVQARKRSRRMGPVVAEDRVEAGEPLRKVRRVS